MSIKIKKAFTLAEVLITLVIIGVIAAITVPTLVNSYTQQTYISALKKNYSVLSNAFKLSRNFDYNDFVDWQNEDGNQNAIWQNYKYLKQYLNVIRECNNTEGCWSPDLSKAPTGETAMSANSKGIGGNIVTFTLTDGTNVCMDYWSQENAIDDFGVSQDLLPSPLSVWVDVNGDKKPNMLGRDVFAFILTKNGLVPAGANNNSQNCASTGYDCAAKYVVK